MNKEKIQDHVNKDDEKNHQKTLNLKGIINYLFFLDNIAGSIWCCSLNRQEMRFRLVFLKHTRPGFSHARQLSPSAFLKSHLESL